MLLGPSDGKPAVETMSITRIPRRYSEVRSEIRSGDCLLYKRQWWKPHHWAISWADKSDRVHCSMAIWARNCLMIGETNGGCGARVVTLSSQVKKCPGRIDVYRPRIDHDAFRNDIAADVVFRFAGQPYGWLAILLTAIFCLPGLRRFLRPPSDDGWFARWLLPYCSALYSWGDRKGGFDPCPGLADDWTTPGDLARSSRMDYLFTLIPG